MRPWRKRTRRRNGQIYCSGRLRRLTAAPTTLGWWTKVLHLWQLVVVLIRLLVGLLRQLVLLVAVLLVILRPLMVLRRLGLLIDVAASTGGRTTAATADETTMTGGRHAAETAGGATASGGDVAAAASGDRGVAATAGAAAATAGKNRNAGRRKKRRAAIVSGTTKPVAAGKTDAADGLATAHAEPVAPRAPQHNAVWDLVPNGWDLLDAGDPYAWRREGQVHLRLSAYNGEIQLMKKDRKRWQGRLRDLASAQDDLGWTNAKVFVDGYKRTACRGSNKSPASHSAHGREGKAPPTPTQQKRRWWRRGRWRWSRTRQPARQARATILHGRTRWARRTSWARRRKSRTRRR